MSDIKNIEERLYDVLKKDECVEIVTTKELCTRFNISVQINGVNGFNVGCISINWGLTRVIEWLEGCRLHDICEKGEKEE